MFESAQLGHSVTRASYARRVPKLREALVLAQYELKARPTFPVIILISGLDGAGKGETVNLLNEWMDPRLIQTVAFGDPADEDAQRPPMWRYWRALPPKGRIGIFFGHWYAGRLFDRAFGKVRDTDLARHAHDISRFEEMLCNEGALLLKFWFHLSRADQGKRLRTLARDRRTAWRVGEAERQQYENYARVCKTAGYVMRETSTAHAPWTIVEGTDPAYRNLAVGNTVLRALRERLKQGQGAREEERSPPLLPAVDRRDVLSALKLDQPLNRNEYTRQREKWQAKLNALSRDRRFQRLSLVAVFEGNDAAGKGSSIRRVTQALDARLYRVVPIAAPTEEERAQPYLWRFWRHIPRRGRVVIFDRSWYGRVLVERVEGLCSEFDWMRAYPEINDFEEQLTASGIVLVKFWLSISKQEQLQRFREREQTPFKRFKLSSEDWRNRRKWNDYHLAVCDMVDRTSTQAAPWTLVEANNRYFARIKILRTLCERIEAALDAD
jgi:polyphosphate:AMP phosphotransferase